MSSIDERLQRALGAAPIRSQNDQQPNTKNINERLQRALGGAAPNQQTAPRTAATGDSINAIATQEVKKPKRTFFEKGAFDDGYQFGDVVKSLVGTDKDIIRNIGAGAKKMAENALDAGATAVGAVSDLVGADGLADKMKNFVAKDLSGGEGKLPTSVERAATRLLPARLQPIANAWSAISKLDNALNKGEDESVLGDRSDALVQGATRFALQQGLAASGVPWQAVSGVTSFGGEAESAFNQDATYGEAALSGAISAGGEILSEYLLGGMFGETGLDDKLVKSLTQKIANKTLRGIVNIGIKAGGEGLIEEPAAWAISKIGQRLSYADDKTLKELMTSEEAIDELVDSVLGGLLFGTAVQGLNAIAGAAGGADTKEVGTTSQLTDVQSPRRNVQNVPALEVPTAESVAQENSTINSIFGNSVGAAKVATGEQAESGSKAINKSNWMDDAAKAAINPVTHERISEEMSVLRAASRIARDSEGNVANFDETVDDLLSLDHWSGEDSDLAQLLMQEAVKRNDSDALAALGSRYLQEGTELAQAFQARKKWIAESPEHIVTESLDALSGADSKTANDVYAIVTELSEEFGKAKTADDYIKIIRDTAKRRRTAGLFSKSQNLSPFANWALARVMKTGDVDFLRTFAANSIVAVAEDAQRTNVADAALSIRRLSMLSKPATFLRNLISTGVFDIVESGTQNMAALIDSGISYITGTRSVAVDKSWASKARRKAAADALAKSFLEVALDVDTRGIEGRYGSSANRAFRMSKNPAARFVSTLEKYMGYGLTTSDEFFRGGAQGDIYAGLQSLVERGKIKEATPGKKAEQKGVNLLENPNEKLAPGTLVKALDRDNFGRIVGFNAEDNTYTVHFRSKSGHKADVKLPVDKVQRAVTAFNKRKSASDVKPQTVEEMIAEMADREAAYRTFHNESGLSKASGLLQKAGNIFHIGKLGVGDLSIPFAKTPANVVSAIFDYSPLGVARGAYQLADVLLAFKNGTINPKAQAQAARTLARGLSGTLLILIAKAAAEEGILVVLGNGKDDDDADATALDKMAGINGVQLNVNALYRKVATGESGGNQDGDFLLGLNAVEPFGAHFAIGAMIAEDITPEMSAGEKLGTFAKDSAYGALSYLSDMPVASPLGDAVNDFIYSDGANVGERLGDAAIGFAAGIPASFVPNVLKGVAQGTDKYQRDAYTADNVWGEMWDSVRAGFPGLRQQLPAKLDSYGQPIENDDGVLNFFNSTVFPGTVTRYEEPSAYDMLKEAYESGKGAGVLPERKAPNSITVDSENVTLDAEDKRAWQQAAGQKHEQLLAAAENNEAFAALPADEQGEVLKDLRSSAAWKGKEAIGYGDSLSDKEKAIAALGAGDWVSYFAYWTAYNEAADDDATPEDTQTLETLLDIPMSDSVEKVIMDGDFGQMYQLTNAGVSVQDYFNYRDAISNIKVAPGYSGKAQWQKFKAIGALNTNDKTKLTLMSDVSDTTGQKIRIAYKKGVSLADAIAYYEAVNARNADGTDKNAAQKNAAIAALGLSDNARGVLNSVLR